MPRLTLRVGSNFCARYCLFGLSLGTALLVFVLYHQRLDAWTAAAAETNHAAAYRDQCFQLYKRLSRPEPSLVIYPPPARPPNGLDFEQGGLMPITSERYFNDAGPSGRRGPLITQREVGAWRAMAKKRVHPGPHRALIERIRTRRELVRGARVAVLGSVEPWAEAVALEAGAANVTTLDYKRRQYETPEPGLEWLHVEDFAERATRRAELESYDAAISSWVQHAGLGRFGEPLSPAGDLDSMRQLHCMLRPGGVLFLGLPTSRDNSSYIVFNAHRVYGPSRLALLLADWTVLSETKSALQSVFILKKMGHRL